jgi:hypothetical protein
MKKSFAILFFILFLSGTVCYSEPDNHGGYAGTPAGFYDDIDPNTLEDENSEDNFSQNRNLKTKGAPVFDNNGVFHEYSDDDGVVVGEQTQVKPTKNYAEIYNNLEPATHSYLHGIDPDEFYDVKDATWSIYPLLRLNSPIYFKNITVEPGYYLLTPREHKGKWYMLFKQNGKVVHIIPVYDRDYTPERFYDEHIPKPKLTKTQKIHMGILSAVGKTKSSKRQEPVKSFLEVNDLDNYFIDIIIYYGGHKYSTIFRTIRL